MSVEIRRAVIEWPSGQKAELSLDGWRTDPRDSILEALLNRDHSLAIAQAKRTSTTPDLLGMCVRRAATALSAQIVSYDPPSAI